MARPFPRLHSVIKLCHLFNDLIVPGMHEWQPRLPDLTTFPWLDDELADIEDDRVMGDYLISPLRLHGDP